MKPQENKIKWNPENRIKKREEQNKNEKIKCQLVQKHM